MSLTLPEPFLARTEPLLGDAAAAFLQAMNDTPPVSVRWNPYKTAGAPDGTPVPWNRYGRYLTERPSFTTDPLFHAGAYYVQEASSMFVEHLVRSAAEALGEACQPYDRLCHRYPSFPYATKNAVPDDHSSRTTQYLHRGTTLVRPAPHGRSLRGY